MASHLFHQLLDLVLEYEANSNGHGGEKPNPMLQEMFHKAWEEIRIAQLALDSDKMRVSCLEGQFTAAQERIQQLENELMHSRNTGETLFRDLEKLRQSKQSLGETAELQRQVGEMCTVNQALQKELISQAKGYSDSKQQLADAESVSAQQRGEIERASAQLHAILEETSHAADATTEKYTEEIKRWVEQNTQLKASLEAKEQVTVALDETVKILKAELKKLGKTEKKLQTALEYQGCVEYKNKEVTEERDNAWERIKVFEKSGLETIEQMVGMQMTLEELQRENEELKSKNKESGSQEIKVVSELNKKLQDEIALLKQRCSEWNANCEKINAKLCTVKATLLEKMREATELSNKLKSISETALQNANELTATQVALFEKTFEADSLESMMADMHSKFPDVRRYIDEAKTTFHSSGESLQGLLDQARQSPAKQGRIKTKKSS